MATLGRVRGRGPRSGRGRAGRDGRKNGLGYFFHNTKFYSHRSDFKVKVDVWGGGEGDGEAGEGEADGEGDVREVGGGPVIAGAEKEFSKREGFHGFARGGRYKGEPEGIRG